MVGAKRTLLLLFAAPAVLAGMAPSAPLLCPGGGWQPLLVLGVVGGATALCFVVVTQQRIHRKVSFARAASEDALTLVGMGHPLRAVARLREIGGLFAEAAEALVVAHAFPDSRPLLPRRLPLIEPEPVFHGLNAFGVRTVALVMPFAVGGPRALAAALGALLLVRLATDVVCEHWERARLVLLGSLAMMGCVGCYAVPYGHRAMPVNADIRVVNTTNQDIELTMDGPEHRAFSVAAGGSRNISVLGGSYSYTWSGSRSLPDSGVTSFEAGSSYEWKCWVKTGQVSLR